jgi:hypothetical protein
MWWRCSECNRLLGKYRSRCVICGKMMCRWCGRLDFCNLHYEEMDSSGKNKTGTTFAVYIIAVVLSFIMLFIFLNTQLYHDNIDEKLIIGSMLGWILSVLIFYSLYRVILRSIHFKHATRYEKN